MVQDAPMRRTLMLTLVGLPLLTACPHEAAGPPKDDSDEPADGETGSPVPPPATTTDTGAAPDPAGMACEDELAAVKKQLEACQAGT